MCSRSNCLAIFMFRTTTASLSCSFMMRESIVPPSRIRAAPLFQACPGRGQRRRHGRIPFGLVTISQLRARLVADAAQAGLDRFIQGAAGATASTYAEMVFAPVGELVMWLSALDDLLDSVGYR